MSLRNKFLVVVSITLLLVSCLFVYVTIQLVSNEWIESKEETNLGFAKEEAREISEWISDQAQKASLVAIVDSNSKNSGMAGLRTSLARLKDEEKRAREQISFFVYSSAKRVEYSDLPKGTGTDSIGTQVDRFFYELRSLPKTSLGSDEFRLAKVGRYIVITVPRISTSGTFEGTLNEVVDFESSAFARSLQDFTSSLNGYMRITDKLEGIATSGAIRLQDSESNPGKSVARAVARSGAFEGKNREVVTYAKIRLSPWYVVVDQPVTNLDSELIHLEENYVWILAAGLLLIIAISYLISNSMVRPIRGLLKGMYKASNREFAPIVVKASGEMKLLVDSFNKMAASLERKYGQTDALNEFSSSVIVDIRENNILNRIGKSAASALDVEIATIMMPDDSGNLKVKGPYGIPQSEINMYEVPAGKGLSQIVFREGRSVISNNADRDPGFYRANDALKRIRKFMSAPIIVGGETIGVLNVANTKDSSDFTSDDVKLLETFANQAGIAIQNSNLYKQLRQDLDRIRMLQDELVQSEKLSAVGQLVSGVAHELNNPLGVILGFSQLANDYTKDEHLSGYLRRIEESAIRASDIVRNLLTFARKETPKRTIVNLTDVVNSVLDLIAHPLAISNITVVKENQKGINETFANFQQLQQVFLNLFTNAMQAMEGMKDGVITVKTFQDGDKLKAVVSDNGPGIKPEVIGKVFDPFFTTKSIGKGTGLGLSVTYSIVKSYGGDIKVESAWGKGATFVVELPAITSVSIEQEEPELHLLRLTGVRVLFVEDEEEMRVMVKDALEKYGCAISAVEDGIEALELLKSSRFDIVVSDLRMPKMDGEEFYRRITSEDPYYLKRFIFSSGDTARESTQSFLKETGCEVLMKPFTIRQLAAEVLRIIKQQ